MFATRLVRPVVLVAWCATTLGCTPGPDGVPARPADLDRSLEAAVRDHDATALASLLNLGKPASPDRLALRAVEQGDVSLLRLLLRAGFDPNAGEGGNAESLLATAARLGETHVVVFLVSNGADPNGRSGPGQAYPPLFQAIWWDHPWVAAALLDAGADPNARVSIDLDGVPRGVTTGPTLLMVATAVGSAEMVELLLGRGADPRLRDWQGRTALAYLAKRQDPAVRIRTALIETPRK